MWTAQTVTMLQRRRFGLSRAAAWQPIESDDMLPVVRKGLAEMGGTETWKEVVAIIVRATNMPEVEAELALALAFNWQGWFQMNCPTYLKPELPPHPNKVQDALQWLQDGPLHLSPDELRVALEKCAKTYMTDPKSSYLAALSTAPEQFREPDVFRALLLREPHALRLTYNCLDTDPDTRPILALGEPLPCDGHCRRCWRTHTPQLMGEVIHEVDV